MEIWPRRVGYQIHQKMLSAIYHLIYARSNWPNCTCARVVVISADAYKSIQDGDFPNVLWKFEGNRSNSFQMRIKLVFPVPKGKARSSAAARGILQRTRHRRQGPPAAWRGLILLKEKIIHQEGKIWQIYMESACMGQLGSLFQRFMNPG